MEKMMIGEKCWVIAEGYIPGVSHGPAPQMESHDTVCILNVTDKSAQIQIYIYFSDREPAGPYYLTIEPRRTRHIRLNELKVPEPVPLEKDYSSVIFSDVPVVVQYTRLDSRQAENALLTTMAYPAKL